MMRHAKMRLGYRIVGFVVRSFGRLFLGLRVSGVERIPLKGRLLIVSNHVSSLDPPLIGSVVPREICYVAKIQLFKGLLGKIITYLNAIPIKRSGSDKEAIQVLSRKLQEDKAVLIFPEGTRSHGQEERAPKAGVGLLALMGNSNLLPVCVEGSDNLKSAFFRKKPLTIKFGQVIQLDSIISEEVSRKDNYSRVAEALMEEVVHLKSV